MICLNNVKQYCKEYWKIENYQEAVNDTEQAWCCHHRFEIDHNMSALELQALGFYFNRPFYELIFLTPLEHKRLHNTGENNPMYGKEAPNKGKHHTEEAKQKMRDTHTKILISAEELYDLYIVQGLSTYKIAEMYGCTSWAIGLKLKKFNISKSKS